MAKAPIPDSLPGVFFVLSYTRGTKRYEIHLDDEDRSSYDLGSDIESIWLQFERWGMKEIGMDAVDRARNFKTVQVIPSQNRIINIFKRPNEQHIDVFEHDKKKRRENAGLRSLY